MPKSWMNEKLRNGMRNRGHESGLGDVIVITPSHNGLKDIVSAGLLRKEKCLMQ
jgi:hypothetical protein